MKKIDKEKKIKLIYSGELLLFAVIFLVFGILKITKVMGYSETRRIVFNWITIFGGAWGIADFIWAVCSKKRQQRISMIDKVLLLPLAVFIMTFDFISLIARPANDNFYIYSVGAAFLYVAVIYTFESIYHYYKPIPGLFDDEEDEPKVEEPSKEESEK
jgi:hypothetical protein